MAALNAARDTPAKLGSDRDVPVAANAKIWAGAMVAANAAGMAVPASAVAAFVTLGVCQRSVDNTGGAAGDQRVKLRGGRFRFSSAGGADLIAQSELGKPVYVVDDNTVAKTSGGGTRPVAGTCFDIDAQGVWVQF